MPRHLVRKLHPPLRQTWLDACYTAYEAANGGRQPTIDYLGFHWYDYRLHSRPNHLDKYNKPIWLTEFANRHSQNDGAPITTLARQENQMTSIIATFEGRSLLGATERAEL